MLAALTLEERVRTVTHERRNAYARSWARSLLRVLGVEMTIDRSGSLETGTAPRLVVANHRSTLDILLMLHLFGGHLLARGDMATWPAIGILARRVDTLFVNRGDPASGAAAVRRIRDRLRRGSTVCVFPEGTTFHGDEVRDFQPGAFVAIAREKGSVLPVGLAYEHPEAIYGDEPVVDHMKRLARARSTRVGVAIGSPRQATGAGVGALAELVRGDVQELVLRARGLVGGGS
jgi:1-acyl-sn-glycerol-3-phosphate acyltransferase